jgi:hypothetical protein
MPLYGGYSRATISKNIRMLRKKEKRPLRQAVAIAMESARRSAMAAGAHPAHLRRKPKRRAKHRRSR